MFRDVVLEAARGASGVVQRVAGGAVGRPPPVFGVGSGCETWNWDHRGPFEAEVFWTDFLRSLAHRGLRGPARLHDLAAPGSGGARPNPFERLNGEIKRRTEVLGIFPNEAAITRLVGAILLEHNDEWAVQRSRDMTLETLAPIPMISATQVRLIAAAPGSPAAAAACRAGGVDRCGRHQGQLGSAAARHDGGRHPRVGEGQLAAARAIQSVLGPGWRRQDAKPRLPQVLDGPAR